MRKAEEVRRIDHNCTERENCRLPFQPAQRLSIFISCLLRFRMDLIALLWTYYMPVS